MNQPFSLAIGTSPTARRLCLLALALTLALVAASAQSMEQLWRTMPDSIVPVLTRNSRLDCADFLDSKMRAQVDNLLQGKSELVALDSTYLLFKQSAASSIEMKVFRADTLGFIVCRSHTFAEPAEESELCFFDSAWRPIDARALVKLPVANDFVLRADTISAEKRAEVLRRLDTPFLKATLSPRSDDIVFSLSLLALADDERKQVEGYLLPSIAYSWTGRGFERR